MRLARRGRLPPMFFRLILALAQLSNRSGTIGCLRSKRCNCRQHRFGTIFGDLLDFRAAKATLVSQDAWPGAVRRYSTPRLTSRTRC